MVSALGWELNVRLQAALTDINGGPYLRIAPNKIVFASVDANHGE